MTNERAKEVLQEQIDRYGRGYVAEGIEALEIAINVLEQQSIDKSAMMYEIYMEGVNMSGEYQGCWVRFKDIEKIVDKYIKGSDAE